MLVCGEPSDDGVRQRRCDSCRLDRWGVDLNDSRRHRRLWRGQQWLSGLQSCHRRVRRSAVAGGVWPFVQLVCGRRCSGPVSCGLACPYRWRVDGIGRLHHISGICRYGRDGIEIDNRLVQQWQRHGRLWVFGPSGRPPQHGSGNFSDAGVLGFWWSSSPYGGNAWLRSLLYSNPDVYRNDYAPRYGFSVRCLRDAD